MFILRPAWVVILRRERECSSKLRAGGIGGNGRKDVGPELVLVKEEGSAEYQFPENRHSER